MGKDMSMKASQIIIKFSAIALGMAWMAGTNVQNADAEVLEWNQWRGPERTGSISDNPFPTSLQSPNFNQQWRVELSPSYSSPIVTDSSIIVTETVDKKYEVVKSFDRTTGEEQWKQSWEGSMSVPFFAIANGSWIRSTPAYDDGLLFVGGMRDVLKCLDTRDKGKVLWTLNFPEKLDSDLPAFGFVSSPLVIDDHVFVQAGEGLVKLDKRSGEIIWKSLNDGGGMMGSAFSSPILATIHGVTQLVVQTRQYLAGVTLDQGTVLWKKEIPSYRGMNILTPTVRDHYIFTSSYRNKNWLLQVNKNEDGVWSTEEVWETRSPAYMSSPVLVGDHLYHHLQSQRLTSLNFLTGRVNWVSPKSFGKYLSMITQGDQILSLNEKGTLSLIHANPNELKVLDEANVAKEPTWAHLAISGNQIIVRELKALTAFSFE